MAFQAERRIALVQQALVDGTVRRMANGATLPQCLVLIHKWAALLRVTLEASFVSAQERETAGFQLLLNICLRAFDRDAFVHFVTIGTADFALGHRVMMWQCERRANFQVTLETGLRRLSWVDNSTRPVAGFAAQVHRFLWSFTALCAGLTHDDLFRLQSRVGSCSEVTNDLFVAGRAFLRADKFCARNTGRSENCAVCRAAGKQNYR